MDKSQNVQIASGQQVLHGRFLRKAPNNLEWLIWLANQAPFDSELPDLDVALGEETKVLLANGKYEEYRAKERDTVIAIIEKLPKKLRDFILHDPNFCLAVDLEYFNSFADRYRFFQSLRKNLFRVADIGMFMRHAQLYHLAGFFPIRLEGVSVVLKPKGKVLRAISDPLVDALTEPGVEVERIRVCAVCERIFWAGRIDAKGCSPQCRSTHNTRLSRAGQTKKRRQYQIERARKEAKAERDKRRSSGKRN